MIMRSFFSLLLLCLSINLLAQSSHNTAVNGQGLDAKAAPWGTVSTFDLSDFSPSIESAYLDESWNLGTIYLNNQKLIDKNAFKFDFLTKRFEIKTENNNIKVLPVQRVDSFDIVIEGIPNRYILTVSEHLRAPGNAIFRAIFAEGNWLLLEKSHIEIVQPNYNRALDAGRREPKKVLKQNFVITDKEKFYEVLRSRKKFSRQFSPEKSKVILNYLKENKIKLKEENDLRKVVSFLKSL